MTCSRCASLMVPDFSLSYLSTEASPDLPEEFTRSYHCVICGNWEDPIIVANRAKRAA